MSQVLVNQQAISRKKAKKQSLVFPRIYKLAFTLAFISFLSWLASTLFLRSYNINLSMEQQQIESKIQSLQVENDAMRVEIQSLNNRERVTNIANDAQMTTDQNNIVTVDGQ